MKLSTYIKLQKFLLTAFFSSIALLAVSSFFSINSDVTTANTNTIKNNNATPTPIAVNNAPVNVNNNSAANSTTKPGEETGYGWVILGGVSLITSLTSLFGFISTTVLAWRKEKRDVEVIRIENEKKELELEKLKWELEKMKQAEADKEPKPKRRKPKPTE